MFHHPDRRSEGEGVSYRYCSIGRASRKIISLSRCPCVTRELRRTRDSRLIVVAHFGCAYRRITKVCKTTLHTIRKDFDGIFPICTKAHLAGAVECTKIVRFRTENPRPTRRKARRGRARGSLTEGWRARRGASQRYRWCVGTRGGCAVGMRRCTRWARRPRRCGCGRTARGRRARGGARRRFGCVRIVCDLPDFARAARQIE